MRSIVKNIFREYNIPCNDTKKRKKQSPKSTPTKASRPTILHDQELIQSFSDDENISPPRYPYIQLRRSFEIPLKLVPVQRCRGRDKTNEGTTRGATVGNKLALGKKLTQDARNTLTPPEEDDSDDSDWMPLPIKEEILSQPSEELLSEPSEEIQLSMPRSSNSSIISSIPSIPPRIRSKVSSDESSISSAENIGNLKAKSFNGSLGMQSSRPSRKEIMARYRPLNISITKTNSTLGSPKKKSSPKRKKSTSRGKKRKKSQSPKKTNVDANLSSSVLDDEPFQSNSADKSFVCSSPKPSQIINTPSSTPSPRKRPTELDLMIELIEKENSVKNTTVRRSPRKASKRCLTGGYEELYQRSLNKAKTDARFLKHDKKYGLRNGTIFRILNVKSSHGVHVALVQNDDINAADSDEHFAIVLPPEMVSQLKSDSRVEAFFDDTSSPYKFENKEDGKCLNVFIKPYKLLLL